MGKTYEVNFRPQYFIVDYLSYELGKEAGKRKISFGKKDTEAIEKILNLFSSLPSLHSAGVKIKLQDTNITEQVGINPEEWKETEFVVVAYGYDENGNGPDIFIDYEVFDKKSEARLSLGL